MTADIKIIFINILYDYNKAGTFSGYQHIRTLINVQWPAAIEDTFSFMGFTYPFHSFLYGPYDTSWPGSMSFFSRAAFSISLIVSIC